ncbi:tRNA lysidine(34) synthetase TilS [Marivirga sp. S37H4]|uniref:tRNA(Ile)-lysidine synthase n=1 Tax=Marivirga aurantiaca TaxID=2802615 RepID=A0A934WVW7_9BACT|nr:tRNA lysidine(34) synthetase TilS [Marivirga aurantiaca]MBK6263929.1 tRNA lysidine(34) synthetase TilS [Marivirga aurantiaca]
MLTDSFLDFIRQEKLLDKTDDLLLAISGGVDSVVLADLLFQNGFKFEMAHMNFQLRGEDSHKDQSFVESLAQKYQVSCHVKKVEITSLDHKKGKSTQMQARQLRYGWFSELMEKHHFNKLLTAHHAEDSLETVLLNLARGTGIKGVRGIKPVNGFLVRPLLFADKNSIRDYAQQQDLQWREDISNQSDAYRRNEMRHHVIPRLVEQNPNLFEGFQATSLRLRAAEEAFEDKISSLKRQYVTEKGKQLIINKEILNLKFGQVYLSEVLKPFGFSLQQLNAFSFVNSGAKLESEDFRLVVDRDQLIVSANSEGSAYSQSFTISGNAGTIEGEVMGNRFSLNWQLCNRSEVVFSSEKNVGYFDFDLLTMPLELRNWKEGDRIQPLGMKGKKKVSDILIDGKVSLTDKEQQLIVASGNQIMWLVNHRVSEQFKITEQTQTILRIEYHEIS